MFPELPLRSSRLLSCATRHFATSARRLEPSPYGSPTAFPFLPANALAQKPNRTKGLTEIRGPYYYPVTKTYLDELLSDYGEYVDGVKWAGGSFSLLPEDRLRALIDTAHKHGGCSISYFRAFHIYTSIYLHRSIPDRFTRISRTLPFHVT